MRLAILILNLMLVCMAAFVTGCTDGIQIGEDAKEKKPVCQCDCEDCDAITGEHNCCVPNNRGGYCAPCCDDCTCCENKDTENGDTEDICYDNEKLTSFSKQMFPVEIQSQQPVGVQPIGVQPEIPVVNLPMEMRQRNWGGGSCVFATTVMQFRWIGRDEDAEYIRKNYSGGQGWYGLSQKLDALGARFAYVTDGDISFLEWACRTRRGAGIEYFGAHYVLLVHLDSSKAGILDNNHTDQIIWVDRKEFEHRWKNWYHGWATALIYEPPPPIPGLPDLSNKQTKPHI